MNSLSVRLLVSSIVTLGLSFVGLTTWADTPSRHSVTIDQPKQRLVAPDFSLRNLRGQTLHLSDYHGKVVVLNFWATFCGPCRREMPALETLWQDYRDQGLVVITVAADRGDVNIVRRFIEEGGYSFVVPLDPTGEVRKRYEVIALPMTYIIGRDGRFSGRALGERQWDSPAIRELLDSLLVE